MSIGVASSKAHGIGVSRPYELHLELIPESGTRFADMLEIARDAESQGWTALILTAGEGAFESLTLLAAVAPHTRRLGLVAEIDPDETHPYTAARRLAALDHVSHGRCGWRLAAHTRNDVADDFVKAVQALWDSWGDNVHLFDRERGNYIDISRIRAAHHAGPHYRIAGPLDIPRPVQGHPVLYGAGSQSATEVIIVEAPLQEQTGTKGMVGWPLRIGHDDQGDDARLFRIPAMLPAWHALKLSVHRGRERAEDIEALTTLRERLGLPRPAAPLGSGPAEGGRQ